jgi:hypothetical protein
MRFHQFSIVDVMNSMYQLLTAVLGMIDHRRAVTGSSSLVGKRLYSG